MNFKKYRMLFICLSGLFLGMPTAAVAGAEGGFYLGLGAGDAAVDASEGDFDESATAYKVGNTVLQ